MELKSEITLSLIAALETAINRYLELDPDALIRLAQFSEKVIAIELTSTGITLFCLPHIGGISIMSHYQGEPDTTISGRPIAMAKLTLLGNTQVMFDGEVKISGDVELGQQFKKSLDSIDIDWEEHLSQLTGDVIAHKAGHLFREISHWWHSNAERARNNSRDYLQQELDILPMSDEAETLYTSIESLRDDTARLEARIRQLNTD